MVPSLPTRSSLALAVALVLLATPAHAQTSDPEILRTVEAAYAGISANADETRDWRAFYRLFLPTAQLVNVRGNAEAGFEPRASSVAEWIVQSGLGLAGRGFVEDLVHSRVEAYGPIAQVFTTWVTRSERGGAVNSRGAATLQLVHTPDGWRVASWIWTGQQQGLPLPGVDQ